MKDLNQFVIHRDSDDRAKQRLSSFGWGALLLVTGSMWLFPKGVIPDGSWAMSVGFLLLGLNAAHYSLHKEWSAFGVALGMVALLGGLSLLLHVALPILGITCIAVGILILAVPAEHRHASPCCGDL